MSDTTNDTEFDWKPLGHQWWANAAKELGASDRQARFAAARFRGCSATESARQGGLTGDALSLRKHGYRMVRTTTIVNLLALAAAESKDGAFNGDVDAAEARRILSKLARGSDPQIKIRALESLAKLDERAVALGKSPSDDGFSEDRIAREYLQLPGGAAAYLNLFAASGGWLGNLRMLKDIYERVQKEDPQLWMRLRNKPTVSANSQVWLDKQINDPTYQFAARQKIWREVGIEIDTPPGAKVENIDAPIAELPQQENE